MNITKQNSDLNAFALKGDMIAAVTNFFADEVTTVDHDGTVITGKAGHLAKMEGFLGGIAKVNGITLHGEASADNLSFSEFTFDFEMKDGSKIFWHEVIRRNWNEGKVIEESYFKI